jgi:hypothetical protein
MQLNLDKRATADATRTAAAIEPAESGSVSPEFLRVPDVERVFGIKRGILYQLIAANEIKSVSLRKKGAKTGLRLVSVPSIREFLSAQLE